MRLNLSLGFNCFFSDEIRLQCRKLVFRRMFLKQLKSNFLRFFFLHIEVLSHRD